MDFGDGFRLFIKKNKHFDKVMTVYLIPNVYSEEEKKEADEFRAKALFSEDIDDKEYDELRKAGAF